MSDTLSSSPESPTTHHPLPILSLSDTVKQHGLQTRKSLGQHFLLDENITDKIVRESGDLDGYTIIEVGPGPGGLTRALVRSSAAKVIALEKDHRCLEALQPLISAAEGRLEVREVDAMTVDISTLGRAPRAIIANLPYNISTALLIKWLEQASAIEKMVLMFQREVADRILADPGSKAYGRLSVIAQFHCIIARQYNLPAEAFTPPPKVASTVVRLEPRSTPLANIPPDLLSKITAAAFGQRRKMLRQSLKSLTSDCEAWIISAGLEPTARAETLSVEDFCRLAESFSKE